MNIVCYKGVIFYKGKFYTNKNEIRVSYLHNRFKWEECKFLPLDIDSVELPPGPYSTFNKGILLLFYFHWNIAHMLWDHVYPSWYGLVHNYNDYKNDFQWLTLAELDDIHVYTHKYVLEKISGSCLDSITTFANKHSEPIIIPWLITGLEDIGIGNVYKNSLLVKRGLDINNLDPIEMFVNHIYYKYNIKRNSLINNSNISLCNNVIFIVNKRKQYGIVELFDKMNNKYSGKYNFKIINYENYTFEQQLNLLNTTCLCIVGVGTARFNTPFLPNGAVEIQTFNTNK
jgi:hypothetical protein